MCRRRGGSPKARLRLDRPGGVPKAWLRPDRPSAFHGSSAAPYWPGAGRALVHAGSLVRLEVIARVGLVEEGTGALQAIHAPEDERRETARARLGLLAERGLGAVIHVLGGGEGDAGKSRSAGLVQRRERRRGHGRGDERRRAATRAPTRARREDSTTPTRRRNRDFGGRSINRGRARGRTRRNARVSRRSERSAIDREFRRIRDEAQRARVCADPHQMQRGGKRTCQGHAGRDHNRRRNEIHRHRRTFWREIKSSATASQSGKNVISVHSPQHVQR